METAVTRYRPHLLWVIGVSVLTAPKSLGAIWQAWRVMSRRRRAEGGEPEGEILSLGVLPAYREPGTSTGKRRLEGSKRADMTAG